MPKGEKVNARRILQETQMKHQLLVPKPGKEAVRISVNRPVIDMDHKE